ncbi:FHA domain-containing serine/threonine-protein kinase [Deinococcus deserti]|uniref:Putative Non-specific serine/threonine protein kinase n=1 Tax=Deinococcus deserti (strain DSM 17065 / CIP 109153 / LMG 22923 / VCD115) TaxID=546414 RepID=C1D122_DEIDV|nr:FHA domain-containing serine/threonine-protein kinase [Deinococcus deserti]ACO45546.1 putative Non-specific serine/threonine protein kinase [Deinococcus deserti VCD115]
MNDSKLFYQYQLHRPLGGGWLGPVHAATDLDEGREVALRILDDANSGQSFLIMQLERLLLKVHSLRHAHLLPTEPLQQREHRVFYAMNLAAHGSLRQLLQRQSRSAQPLPLVTAVEAVRQAAAGLAYAHAQGLMHGNLKPENVLLQPGRALVGNDGYTVQLSDFGLAELRAGAHGTHDRAVVGALAYTSPEQCRGVRNELRTDLYTLGLILYELVTGMVPFDIRDAADALEKHQHVAPRQPTLLRPDVPEALEEVILTCLAKRPDDRYADAGALEAALQAVLNTMLPSGPDPTVRLPTLPVMPVAPAVNAQPAATPRLLVYSERHELLRELPVTGSSLTIGRAPGNSVLLEHQGVSRHHLNVEFSAGQPYVTELTATNGTLMDGLPLTPMTRLRWPYRTPLYLRPYWLILIGPEEQQARPRIVVKPEVERLTLVPGVATQLNVVLVNTGQTVDHFQLSLDGIPAEWLQNPYQEVQLNPGTQASASLTVLAPKRSSSRAGDYPVTVLARSRENTAQFGKASLTATVTPFTEVVATLAPPIRRTWRRTTYAFKLDNRSNVDGTFAPRLHDNQGDIRLIPRPQDLVQLDQMGQTGGGLTNPGGAVVDPTRVAQEAARHAAMEARNAATRAARHIIGGEGRIRMEDLPARVALKAGETSEDTVRVRVPIRWVGMASKHQFTIHVLDAAEAALHDSGNEDRPVSTASAELHHNALIPLWLLPILLLLLGALIWFLTRPPVINQFDLVGSNTVVRPGQPFSLRWDTQNARRVDVLELGKAGQHLSADGTVRVSGIKQDQKYTLVARNLIGIRREMTRTIEPRYATPVIEQFVVSPTRVAGNQPVTISWRVRGAEQISITELGRVPASGKRTITPSRDLNLQITARNGSESTTDGETVSVIGAKINVFKLQPEAITRGTSATLSWNVENATSVSIDGIGTVPAKGKKTVSPRISTSYVITAQGGNNSVTTANTRLEVAAAAPKITAFSISPQTVKSNQDFTITWRTENATSVTLQDGTTTETANPIGRRTLRAPAGNSDIVITASNEENVQVTKSLPLTVIAVDEEALQAKAEAERAAAQKRAEEQRQAQEEERNVKLITFTAEPAQISGKGDVTLSWDAPGFKNVQILPLSGPTNGLFDTAGSQVVKDVNTSRTYTLRVRRRDGQAITITRKVKVVPLPVQIRSFKASQTILSAPGDVSLSWDVANTTAVRISGLGAGKLPGGLWPAQGSASARVDGTTTFVLKAGSQQARATVTLPPPAIQEFRASPGNLTGIGTTNLSWRVRNISSVRIDGLPGPNPDGSWPVEGRTSVPVSKTRVFTLRAGKATRQSTVTVTPPAPPRIVSFTPSTTSLKSPGGKVTLKWDVANTDSVRITNAPSARAGQLWPARGTTTVNVSRTTVFILTSGSQQRSITVAVAPQPVPPSAQPKPPQEAQPPQSADSVQEPNIPVTTPARIVSFTASPTTLQAGESVRLSWKVEQAEAVRIDGVPGSFQGTGSVTVTPRQTTTYVLRAAGLRRDARVTVRPARSESPYADLVGTWNHPFGYFTVHNIQGRRASGVFVSQRDHLKDIPVTFSFAGNTLTASSPDLEAFSLVATLNPGRQSFTGTYTLRGARERWCAYRPSGPQNADCN